MCVCLNLTHNVRFKEGYFYWNHDGPWWSKMIFWPENPWGSKNQLIQQHLTRIARHTADRTRQAQTRAVETNGQKADRSSIERQRRQNCLFICCILFLGKIQYWNKKRNEHNESIRLFRTALEQMPANDSTIVIRADKWPSTKRKDNRCKCVDWVWKIHVSRMDNCKLPVLGKPADLFTNDPDRKTKKKHNTQPLYNLK